MKPMISIAYSGVHQAYQLALAAHQLGRLERFYCSLFAAPGKWGGLFKNLLGADALRSRAVSGLPRAKICEIPWPLMAHRCRARLKPKSKDDWAMANHWFDRRVARLLRQSASAVFVGVETCAAQSFAVAHQRGMVRILDCPGIDAEFLTGLALAAADEFDLTTASKVDSPIIRDMKAHELQLADAIFVGSEFQARLVGATVKPRRGVHVLPLWADQDFWQPAQRAASPRSAEPLKIIYAGKISLRKGMPYLLRAVAQCGVAVELTLAGNLAGELQPLLQAPPANVRLLPACSKSALRTLYQEQDLLVLPSLGDAFGFVAMEAMACGLPVIVTENCGVPVPDPSWRVPVMNSEVIADRLALYAEDRERCRADGRRALVFARQFTPARYRQQASNILAELASPLTTGADTWQAKSEQRIEWPLEQQTSE
jgi:glycosyltransferase involved in cell wall biosynthesis